VKKLTTTSYAILALLAVRPWSAYELSQQMRQSVGEFWPRAERGLYDEPKNLVAHGFASATDERHGRRARTVYAITAAGRRRIAFAEHGQKADALRTLANLRAQVEERRRYAAAVARAYVEGQGRYPERVHTISLIIRFFADYYDVLDSWAAWASEEIESWGDIRRPPGDGGPLETLAGTAAVRPAGMPSSAS
jgi:DNA-binding PadR family transcriptional regulator